MSAFYLLGLFAVWVALTVFILRQWQNRRKRAETGRGRVDVGFALITLVWLAASFWYSGGQKFYWDYQVNKLCAIDGGIKVYETVTLPADKFNQWGQVNFYNPTLGENALGSEYVYRSESIYLHRGDPNLRKDRELIFRKADMRLLGEATAYVRGGGDIPGPWQPSAYRCPSALSAEGAMLMNKIFIR